MVEERRKTPECLLEECKVFPFGDGVGRQCATGVSQLCFLCSTVTTAVYQDVLEHFMVPAVDNLFGAVEFTFQQDSVPAHTVKTIKKWLE